MTPFGALLRYYRTVRGITQQELARRLDADFKLISSMETGRRSPPSGGELERLCAVLNLADCDQQQLMEAAHKSSYVIRLPRDISAIDLELVHRLVHALNRLEPSKKSAIQHLIEERRCA
jgi:HTH-type transcriptional regulator, competence development regulator